MCRVRFPQRKNVRCVQKENCPFDIAPGEVQGEANSAGEYRQPQKVYAERYGYSVRAIKGWVAEGRAAGDPCPLDDASAMPDWWSRVKQRRVPPRLLKTAGHGEPEAEAVDQAEGLPLFCKPPATAAGESESGFRASVHALREAEARARQGYFNARDELERATTEEAIKTAEGKVERLRRAWNELSKELRISEKALLELESQTGDMLPKAEVRRELLRIHGAIYTGFKNLVRRVRPKLEGKLSTEQDAIWGDEVNRLFQAYQEGDFMPGFVTDDRVA